MTRFNDATSSWFMVGDDPDQLSGTIEIDLPSPKSRLPKILLAVAMTSAAAMGTVWIVGHSAELSAARPPVLQIPVVRSTPPAPEPPSAPPVAPAIVPTVAMPEAKPVVTPIVEPEPAAPVAGTPRGKSHSGHSIHSGKSGKTAARMMRQAARQTSAVRPSHNKPAPAAAEVVAGEKLLKQHQYGAALEQFQKLLAHDADDVRALRGACVALAKLGRTNDAARVCRHALNLVPDDLATRSALASIYYSGGAYQWSANEWKRVLDERPGDPQALKGLRAARARL